MVITSLSGDGAPNERVVSRIDHEAVNDAHPLGPGTRVLTGFPPRYFLRLEPQ